MLEAPKPLQSPRRKHGPTRIKVRVFDIKSKQKIRDFSVNLSAGGRKDWLFDLTLWAVLNTCVLEISHERDGV